MMLIQTLNFLFLIRVLNILFQTFMIKIVDLMILIEFFISNLQNKVLNLNLEFKSLIYMNLILEFKFLIDKLSMITRPFDLNLNLEIIS